MGAIMKFHLSALALLTSLLLATVACAAPELTVEKGTFNFGTVTQGKRVQHNFVIKNSGDAPLLVKQLTASCGCTAAKPSASTIPPGKSGEIQVTFDSTNFSGKVQKTVQMTTNAGKTPVYTFTLDGTVAEELQVSPQQLSLGQLAPGQTKQATITVTNRGTSSVKLLAVNFTSSSLQMKATIKKPELKPGESGTIEVSITPHAEAKILSGYLHIMTSSPQKKEITVSVYASITH